MTNDYQASASNLNNLKIELRKFDGLIITDALDRHLKEQEK